MRLLLRNFHGFARRDAPPSCRAPTRSRWGHDGAGVESRPMAELDAHSGEIPPAPSHQRRVPLGATMRRERVPGSA